jgi:uncharacterized protein (TIGR04255 family)
MPLKSMLCQMRFPVQGDFSMATASRIHNRLTKHFPRLLEEPQAALLLGPNGVQTQTSTAFRLTTFDQQWSVVLTQDAVTLETTAYIDWPNFKERFEEVLAAVQTVVSLSSRERIGLRYVNEIRPGGAPVDWSKYVKPELLGWLANASLTEQLFHHLAEARFAATEWQMILRYGIVNRAAGPSGESLPFYLLDIDCSDARPEPFDSAKTLEDISIFNDAIWRLFHWSLSDSYLQSMHPTT